MKAFFFFMLVIVAFAERVDAHPGFYYTGTVAATDSEEHAQAHACLSLVVFLESRSESRHETDMVGSVILNRAQSNRFPNSVCEVVLQRSQFEPVSRSRDVREALNAIRDGELFAGYDLIASQYNTHRDYQMYTQIERQMYYLMYRQGQDLAWSDALFFYSPDSLLSRGLPIPRWIASKEVVYVGERHIYLR